MNKSILYFAIQTLVIWPMALVCEAARVPSVYKDPDDDCPKGYHEGEYPNVCVHCSRICYPGMDQHTENNCNRLCPGFLYSTTSENLLTTVVPTTTTGEQHQSIIVIVVILSVLLGLSMLFGLTMFVLFCFRKSLLRRCRIVLRIRTGNNVVKEKMPIQVTEDIMSTTPLSPNTGQPGLLSPNTGQPGLLSPNTGQPGLLSPNTGQPGLLSPNTVQTGILSPDTVQTGILSPNTGQTGLLSPNTGQTGLLSQQTETIV